MNAVPTIEPVTMLQRNHKVLLGKLDKGPVIISNAGRAVAVLVSVEEWDKTANELAALRSDERMTKREVEVLIAGLRNRIAGGPRTTHEELKQMMMERSANVAN